MADEQDVKMCSTKYLVNEMGLELKTEELTDAQQYLLIDGNCPFKRDIGYFYFNGYPAEINNIDIDDNQLFPYSAVTRVEYPDMEWEVGDGADNSLDPFPNGTLISENNVIFNVTGFSSDKESIQIQIKDENAYFNLSTYGLYFNVNEKNISVDSNGNGTITITFGINNAKILDSLVLTPNSSAETIDLPVRICGKGKNGKSSCTELYSIKLDNSKHYSEENPHGKLLFESNNITLESEGTSINFQYEHIKIDSGSTLSGFTFDSGNLQLEASITIDGSSTNDQGTGLITLKPFSITEKDFDLKISAVEQYYTTSVSALLHISVN